MPAFNKIPNLIEIEFFPYGKASTNILPDGENYDKNCTTIDKYFLSFSGSLKFVCQHGEPECEANIIHCCAIEAIHDAETRLNVIACMIRDNNNPTEAFQRVRNTSLESTVCSLRCLKF